MLAATGKEGSESTHSWCCAAKSKTAPASSASVVWQESQSSYIAVARIVVGPQDAWSPLAVAEIDERLSFSPWPGVAAHRPFGSVMRARKATYESSADLRAVRNNARSMNLA